MTSRRDLRPASLRTLSQRTENANRLFALLAPGKPQSVASFAGTQNDVVSLAARELVPLFLTQERKRIRQAGGVR